MKDTSAAAKFAEAQLTKYGWKQGDGIGKTNQGIAAPIKASLKFDNAGVGFNMAEEFTVNWWEHLYNSSANKINKNGKSSGGDTNTAQENALEQAKSLIKDDNEDDEKDEDSTNKTSTAPLTKKSYFYSRFQKGSVLLGGETIQVAKEKEEPKKEEVEVKEFKISDEELLKACEGRTAHKGARHGIKMNGKLARIEEQERLQLLSMKQASTMAEKECQPAAVVVEETKEEEDEEERKKRKREKKEKKRREREMSSETSTQVLDQGQAQEKETITIDDDTAENKETYAKKKSKTK